MHILAPYLPTIILIILAGYFIGADILKSKKVYQEHRQEQRQAIIDEHEEACDLQENLQSINDGIKDIKAQLSDLSTRMTSAEGKLTDLTISDMHDIKGWIVEQYHKFYNEQGWIDAFSAETIDRRYNDYKKEGGNSYVKELIDRLHSLPMDPPLPHDKDTHNE
jgi:gamma-glutamylcysteine synthetase